MKTIRIRTFYPADPVGIVPGGVDTFIRGLIKWAPEDIEFSLVGMTTDAEARPVGQWCACDLRRRQFAFLPVTQVADAGRRSRLPLALRFTSGALRFRGICRRDFDVFEFHRVEPALLYLRDPRPKNAFFHQDMAVIRTEAKADILWRKAPVAYFALERTVVRSLSSAWCVREEGARSLRLRYPFLAQRIDFVPTWVDPEVFFPVAPLERSRIRSRVEASFGLAPGAFRIISVGRLDTQKNPERLLTSVADLIGKGQQIELLFVGDGVLRSALEKQASALCLAQQVRFLGLRSPGEIHELHQAVDCFALSSDYEGMPMALLEALGSGLPVVTTPVGEVARVVQNGVNGEIAKDRSVDSFTASLRLLVGNPGLPAAATCAQSVGAYSPDKVLAPVYENYRRLGGRLSNRGDDLTAASTTIS